MKTFFRYFFLLVLCSCRYTASVGTDDSVSYLVGNDYEVGSGDRKWRETGPGTGITVRFRHLASTNSLVPYRPIQLGPTSVSLYWFQLDSASGGGYPHYNRGNTASDELMAAENQMVDSDKHYGGYKPFEMFVLGLYYTLKISNIWSSYITTNTSPLGMYVGDSPT